ncbi:TPA: DNA-directed RNA polymerase subunit B'' [Candidatus Woesearchaeota archaeon]|nr:DNA-directed RNA polymerase subunit B'' [Candidatus Woesearchaeota archaeon]HIH31704.1 DNA-directed RNA polymerase subunit B'' [Candidatus Woesearchaeota archaeon]HIH55008.1 DNA-directed RNA polymerase subunit B'' [Candidatus Woesearchaeota archaeon]HIJ01016.1 DNA-directed RNA polymerase subunit B'' [Candidatus Woesearchaeota archaeon]HIJ14732.1 DNA-directed RNA polymerase subunit B'' [Candidatus Woesearchaeota archaeon]
MNDYSRLLIKKYFEENSMINADIKSFNYFIDVELQKIIEENRVIEPTIIPSNVEEYKIILDKISITKPEITEADGAKRIIYPNEARLRKLSYSAPIFIEISSHINGVQRESFRTQIGSIPIMLKSKYCHLFGLSKDELIDKGEDPDDPGGYFIINGTEKALVKIEDLAANKFLISETSSGVTKYEGKVFSERGSYKIPHLIEKLKDGMVYLSFTRVKRIPIIIIVKALGLTKDEDIMKYINLEESSEVFINLYEFVDIKTEDDAVDYIAKKIGIMQTKEIRMERTREILDKYLLPHIGLEKKDRITKAMNLCKFMRKYILVYNHVLPEDDRDHYMNKRLKMSGDLLADLVRANLKILIGDMLYNFQRIVKRGKFPNLKVIIRDKLLTQRVYSSMATGTWVGGRKGISQRMERLNFLQVQSTLQRVISPLSASQENFEARTLHPTQLGRLCPAETPEGTNIGLRKNLALLASITHEIDEEEVLKSLKALGLEAAK